MTELLLHMNNYSITLAITAYQVYPQFLDLTLVDNSFGEEQIEVVSVRRLISVFLTVKDNQ